MKKVVSIMAALLFFIHASAQPQTPASYSVKLQLQSTNGTNSSAVTYNTASRMYYTIIAGNADYPIDVFDAGGNWQTSVTAGEDMRGFWYNATSNTLEGNNTDGELYSWGLNRGGLPDGGARYLYKNTPKPDMQSVGFYANGMIYYYNNGVVYSTSSNKPVKLKKLKLAMSISEVDGMNSYTMGYTGVPGYEIILLQPDRQSVVFFNKKGKWVSTVKLPNDVTAADKFRFSFCNNMAWLYDTDARTWYGYKVF